MEEALRKRQPTLSIIVPVYNVEKYLPKCIESILNQTFTDFELILIDDGSTDKSGEICEEYQQRDDRVKVIHKENGGLSSSRNKGLDIAKGAYVGFVDSDDYIHPQMYEILIHEARDLDNEIVICRYKCWMEDEEVTVEQIDERYQVKNMDTEESLRQLLKGQLYRHGVCNKMFKATVIKDTRFPIGKIYEDNFFTYKVLGKAKKIKYVDLGLYYYLQREGSTIHKQITERNLAIFEAGEEIIKFIEEKYPSLIQEAEYAYITRLLDLSMELRKQQDNIKLFKRMQCYIRKRKIKQNAYLTVRQKVLLLIYAVSVPVYRRLIQLL